MRQVEKGVSCEQAGLGSPLMPPSSCSSAWWRCVSVSANQYVLRFGRVHIICYLTYYVAFSVYVYKEKLHAYQDIRTHWAARAVLLSLTTWHAAGWWHFFGEKCSKHTDLSTITKWHTVQMWGGLRAFFKDLPLNLTNNKGLNVHVTLPF